MKTPFLHIKKEEVHPANSKKTSFGDSAADFMTQFLGSWKFIITFVCFLISWMIVNVVVLVGGWDPYPFILLNLVLSCLAALQAPIIMMSQNRQAQRDRITAKYDYAVNRKAEREIQDIQKDLEEIKRLLKKK